MDVEHPAHHRLRDGCGVRGRPLGGAGGRGLESPYPAAAKVLREHVSVDVHTHAGPNGVTSRTAAPSDDLARSMRAGRIAVLCLADVPDGPILGRDASNVLRALREPPPGFLYQYHLERLGWVDELCAKRGIRRILTAADVKAAHAAAAPAIIMDIEGLDFLERKLERLEESYRRGVRTMQLVHYTPNDIGDFQTGAVTHNGLTPFGADVIRACNRLGVVVDVAHATADTVKQAVKATGRPLLLSHTALRGSKAQGETPLVERQITPDHARAIAETGGSIGVWHFFATPELYVQGLKEMADVVGVDHVSIGTDASGAAASSQTTTSSPARRTRCCGAASHPRTPPRSWAATTCGSSRRPSGETSVRRGRG
jgi:membrane dipeptidase